MMKRAFILYAFVAILGVATNASERTESQMQAIAGQQLLGAMAKGNGPAVRNVTLELKDVNLSVYSAEGRGFVVVSRDDSFPAVLGTSSAPIDMNNLPEGFSWWLKEANSSMQRRLKNGERYTATRSVTVEPFLTTKWDQSTPFNLKCPKVGTEYCPTGCVATATAQVMKYYNYPEQGQGTGSYTNKKIPKVKNINSVYDWANMKDYYANNLTTMTTEVEAVATLMSEVGAAVGMDYTASYGSATMDDCARGLVNNFKYDSLSLRLIYRAFFNDVEWQGLIYNELTNKRPILYAGSPEDGSAGHAFVFHGLDADGKVYVNWGWSGICDGYFDFNVLLPGKEAKQHGDFSSYSQMLFNFNPTQTPEEGTEEVTFWVTDTTTYFSLEKDSLILNARGMYNYNYRNFRGQLYVNMANTNGVEDDNIDILLYDTEDEEYGEPVEPLYGFVFNSEDRDKYGQETLFYMKDDMIKPGTYVVTLVSQGLYESEPSPMRYYGGVICQSKLVKSENGSIELTDYTPTAVQDVKRTVRTDASKVYDLRGRQVKNSSARRGIYIIGNKKVIR